MTNFKYTATPFLSGVELEDGGTKPLVNNAQYRQLVGSFLYLTHTRLDISYVVGAISRYMQERCKLHWKYAKRIISYVKGTHNFGIHYATYCTLDLVGYTYLDWDDDGTYHNSTSGYVFNFVLGPICWSSK
jgi:hypothetical protein